MIILHIASINNNKFRGVPVAVSNCINAQQKKESVALVNFIHEKIDGINNQFFYQESIFNVPEPFNKPDIVIIHEVYSYGWRIHRITKELKSRKVPYIIVPHGELKENAQKYKWIKKKLANIILFNHFINNATAIQCLSHSELETTHFRTEKFIATNGVTVPNVKKEKNLNKKIVFSFIGRLDVYYKGLDILLKAISLYKKETTVTNFEVNLYGPSGVNNCHKQIRSLIEENGVADCAFIHDGVVGLEKERVLLNTDVFIQTSRSEGMPIGILEAMSYGIPCLVTEGTSLGDVIRDYDAGWVTSVDHESVKEGILKALSSKDYYYQKGINARKCIEELFSWEVVTDSTLERYRGYINK